MLDLVDHFGAAVADFCDDRVRRLPQGLRDRTGALIEVGPGDQHDGVVDQARAIFRPWKDDR